ncbi:hypothetical protein OROMI_007088 [Orobanche minor]
MLGDNGRNTASIFGMVAWQIWKERNSMVWDKVCKTPTEAVFSSAGLLKEWMEAKLTATIVPTAADSASRKCGNWHPLPLGAYKINTDAGLFADDNMMGVGLVQRGSSGEFVRAKMMTKMGPVDATMAEAWGFLEAVRWAEAMGLVDVVEGDAKVVVDAINRGTPKFILISVHDYNLPSFLLSSGYFTGKRKAESEVLSKYPMSGVVFRPGFIYGRRKLDGFEIPLDLIGEPIERFLTAVENFTKPFNSLPASDLLLAPPLRVDDIAFAVTNAITDDNFFGIFTIEQIKEAAVAAAVAV